VLDSGADSGARHPLGRRAMSFASIQPAVRQSVEAFLAPHHRLAAGGYD
jgi:hypothetical protein